MSFVNYSTREVHCKIVYAGVGLGGKTTNLQVIYDQTTSDRKSKLSQYGDANERTLFFDFLPLELGSIKGYQTKLHLYTIPGQTFYESTRPFVLKGVDGVVFVVDSAPERLEANLESLEQIQKALHVQGYDPSKVPWVFQYNKRDLSPVLTLEELETKFNPIKRPFIEAVASQGIGVMETLESITNWVLEEIQKG